ncbi:MAG: hypothetical protein KDC66_05675 [Phaeodactylibacter sp.]|nr:hypothetical protein [Phaeodactylibacter sp.]
MQQKHPIPVSYAFRIAVLILLTVVGTNSCKKDDLGAPDDTPTGNTVGVPTIDGAYEWSSVAIGGGGFVTGIITSPVEENLIYARTDVGGAYRWIEASKSWKPLTDFVGPGQTSLLGIESIALDPHNAGRTYIAAGTEYWDGGLSCILISNDYGETFEAVNVTSMFQFHGNGMGRQNGERLAVDPNLGDILFCGTRKHGLWKSENGGHNWTKVSSFPASGTANGNGICFITFDSSSGTTGAATQRIFAGVSRSGSANIFVSDDGGQNWQPVADAPIEDMPMRSLLANGQLYVSYANAEGPWNCTTGSLWKYKLADGTWTDISPESGTAFSGISISRDHTTLVASSLNKWINQGLAWGDEIYRSTDDGASWERLFQGSGATASPGDITWTAKSSIHWAGDIKIDPFNSSRAFIISGNGVYRTTSLTSPAPVWQNASNGIEETVPLGLVSIPEGPLVSVIGDYDGYMHADIHEFPLTSHFPSIGTTTGIAYAGQSPNFVVRVGGDEGNRALYYSENYGESWLRAPTSQVGRYRGHVAVSADGQCILWAPESGNSLHYTTDRGQSWATSEGISGNLSPVADYVNPNAFYAYSPSGKFYKSLDKGRSFTTTITSITGGATLIRAVFGQEGHVLIAGKGQGLHISKNYGLTFEKIEAVTYCEAVGTGKGPDGSNYPSIYIYGQTENDSALAPYRSDDGGASWVRINDSRQQFGSLANGQFIIGDKNVFGRVYRSTAGRGIAYGQFK